ncbi:hypothetical protein ACTXT7_009227 [Hymenolepis weldensis]
MAHPKPNLNINHVDVTRACHAEVVKLLDALKSNAVVLQMTRPSSVAPDPGHKTHHSMSRNATIGVGDGPVKSTVQRSVSMAGRMNRHNNGPAPYSPMLPMHAPPHSRCISPGGSSVSSTVGKQHRSVSNLWVPKSSFIADCENDHRDIFAEIYGEVENEPFGSQSRGHTSPRMISPCRTNNREPIPRVHTAADYRIRNKFPNPKHTETTQGGGGKGTLRQIPKSHTVNSFTEVIPIILYHFTLCMK